jgi:hypothetical protein
METRSTLVQDLFFFVGIFALVFITLARSGI